MVVGYSNSVSEATGALVCFSVITRHGFTCARSPFCTLREWDVVVAFRLRVGIEGGGVRDA